MHPATASSRERAAPAPTAAAARTTAAPVAPDDATGAPRGVWWRAVGAATAPDLKLGMAASGTVLSVFTVGHMAGNMQVYLGRERFNRYALLLRGVGSPVLPPTTLLWVARAGLLASAGVHVVAGTELTLRSWRAEGRTVSGVVRHAVQRVTGADPARSRPRGRRRSLPRVIARSMRSTGAVLGLFVTFHVLDLTTGTRPAASRGFEHGDSYGNLVASLSRPAVAAFYAASMAALAGHMIHGLRTAALDTGLTGTAQRVRQVDVAAKAVGAVVALGNVGIPVAVQIKVVR